MQLRGIAVVFSFLLFSFFCRGGEGWRAFFGGGFSQHHPLVATCKSCFSCSTAFMFLWPRFDLPKGGGGYHFQVPFGQPTLSSKESALPFF